MEYEDVKEAKCDLLRKHIEKLHRTFFVTEDEIHLLAVEGRFILESIKELEKRSCNKYELLDQLDKLSKQLFV